MQTGIGNWHRLGNKRDKLAVDNENTDANSPSTWYRSSQDRSSDICQLFVYGMGS